MSDTGIIAIVVGVVAIALLMLYRTRLAGIAVDGRKRRVNVSMDRRAPGAEARATQERVQAAGDVTLHAKTGAGVSQTDIQSGGSVSAVVELPASESAAKKR